MWRHSRLYSLSLLARKYRRLPVALLIFFGRCQHIDLFQRGILIRLFSSTKESISSYCLWSSGRNGQEGNVLGHLRHEHRGPWTLFSAADRPQSHCKAAFLPQEHLACEAQTQLFEELDLPQQEVIWAISSGNMARRIK